ncbi:hypothetical protein [Desulfosporosinus sp.]|nr:hypothetical protein [Desulfosporosinus sp.]MDA8220427.1 hypothetical protein [Desulfitobacterium hafniense]
MTIKNTMEEVGGIAVVVVVIGIVIAFLTTNLPTYLMSAFTTITQ